MKKILFYLLSVLILASCSNEIPEHHQPKTGQRTILAYLVANNNLDSYIQDNVKWMYEGLSQAEDIYTLVIYYKPRPSNRYFPEPCILKYQTDGYGNINGQPALKGKNANMANILAQAQIYPTTAGIATNPNTMAQIFDDMQKAAPASNYGLIFGSHASGWLPASQTTTTFSFGIDEGPTSSQEYAINIPELAYTLENSFHAGSVDFLLFDACMMATAEVCYELRHATKYCIASVMETPSIGYPYDRFLLSLYAEQPAYANVCKQTTAFGREKKLWGAYSVIDCSLMEDLAMAIKAELNRYQDKLWELPINEMQQYGIGIYEYFSFDIVDFIKQLNGGTLPENFQDLMDRTIIAKDCIDDSQCHDLQYKDLLTDKSRYCGIGMYYPTDRNSHPTWNNYFRSSISWYEAAGWKALTEVQ